MTRKKYSIRTKKIGEIKTRPIGCHKFLDPVLMLTISITRTQLQSKYHYIFDGLEK